ncbi:MAG: amino acid aminotransferase [Caldilineaceae bacterium]
MLEKIQAAPPDPILGLTEAFKSDPNPRKINLGVGVYKDENGLTPVLNSVKQAEERILTAEKSKSYLPIDGAPAYTNAVQEMLFGADHALPGSGRVVSAQAPGGTGALRVAADFLAGQTAGATVWVSDPTWPNHPGIFQSAGLAVKSYPYFDKQSNGVAFDALLAALAQMPAGDVIVLHGCCHNPTGVDLSAAQWAQVSARLAERQVLPLLDFAYQGFAEGLDEDAVGLRTLCQDHSEMLVASSFSKNFGLYNERIGALTLVGANADAAQAALSHIKRCIRSNYSNPPAHGAAIVGAVLGDVDLRRQWQGEVTEMRDRINTMRHLFVETLNEKGAQQDFSFIARQRGMFSFSGLNPAQVQALRDKYGIYIVGSGRINVAGMSAANMDYLCEAIVDVLE